MKKILLVSFLTSIFVFSGVKAQWIPTNGPEGGSVETLAQKGDYFIAGTWGTGVYTSTNNGANWKQSSYGLTGYGLAINKFLIKDENIFIATNGGVYLSSDDCSNWQLVNNGMTNAASVKALALLDDILLAGTSAGEIFATSITNIQWSNVTSSLPWIRVLYVKGNNIYAGTDNGIFCSTDNGTNWIEKNNGLTNKAINTIVSVNDTLFTGTNGGGAFLSADEGENWNSVQTLPLKYISCLCANNNDIYAAYSNFLYRSADKGKTWIELSVYGFGGIKSILLDIDTIYTATARNGISKSIDKGYNWVEINKGISNEYIIASIVSKESVVLGTPDGIKYSSDSGSTWNEADMQIKDLRIFCLKQIEDTLYAGSNVGEMYTSNDNGRTWTRREYYGANIAYFYTLQPIASSIVAGTNNGIMISRDYGSTWEKTGNGLPRTTINCSLATMGKVFVGTNTGIYVSTDGGYNWTEADSGVSNKYIWSMAADDSVIYVGSSLGIYRSTDEGNFWENIFPTFSYAYSLHCKDNILIAGGTNTNKLFVSSDTGNTWEDKSKELDFLGAVTSLCSDEKYLYAGTQSGVWKRDLSEIITSVENEKGSLLSDLYLSQNYPNPFNPTTTISYSIPVVETGHAPSLHVLLKVYDVLGREVATLVNEAKPAGNYHVNFNAGSACGGLTSGIYFYTLKAGEFTQTKKLILMK